MSKFFIGQKVICTGEDWCEGHKGEISPRIENKLTIREIVVTEEGWTGLRFEEIKNKPVRYAEGLIEVAFESANFTPVKHETLFSELANRELSLN